jgi:hypothetical protein
MDETVVQVLHERNRSAHSKSYMWVARGLRRKPLIFFTTIEPAKEIVYKFLAGYRGFVQNGTVRSGTMKSVFPRLTHVGCLAHVRRSLRGGAAREPTGE